MIVELFSTVYIATNPKTVITALKRKEYSHYVKANIMNTFPSLEICISIECLPQSCIQVRLTTLAKTELLINITLRFDILDP